MPQFTHAAPAIPSFFKTFGLAPLHETQNVCKSAKMGAYL
jgi:hypothetical protein